MAAAGRRQKFAQAAVLFRGIGQQNFDALADLLFGSLQGLQLDQLVQHQIGTQIGLGAAAQALAQVSFGLAGQAQELAQRQAGAAHRLLLLLHHALDRIVDQHGRVFDGNCAFEYLLQDRVGIFSVGFVLALIEQALTDILLQGIQRVVIAHQRSKFVVQRRQLVTLDADDLGVEMGLGAGAIGRPIVGVGHVEGDAVTCLDAKELLIEAGREVLALRLQDQLEGLVVNDLVVAGSAFDLHGQQVAVGCAFAVQRQPFSLLFLHLQQLGLDFVLAHLDSGSLDAHGAIIAQIHLWRHGQHQAVGQGVEGDILQHAGANGLEAGLFQCLLVYLVAHVLGGLFIQGFLAEGAHHSRVRGLALAKTGDGVALRHLGSGLAQGLLDLLLLRLDDQRHLRVGQTLCCDFQLSVLSFQPDSPCMGCLGHVFLIVGL